MDDDLIEFDLNICEIDPVYAPSSGFDNSNVSLEIDPDLFMGLDNDHQ